MGLGIAWRGAGSDWQGRTGGGGVGQRGWGQIGRVGRAGQGWTSGVGADGEEGGWTNGVKQAGWDRTGSLGVYLNGPEHVFWICLDQIVKSKDMSYQKNTNFLDGLK